ncbi:HAD family hydrolase [Neisseria sp.]|uniref:HAD family hydrolase n=1 Tax=Neisseria sp. TaxID=192066 RepID=UPI00359FD935
MTEAVFFDLDGTLADTALDLGGALNSLLRSKGLPEKSMDEIRPVASHGSAAFIKLGAGITPDHPDFQTWRQAYLDEYGRCFDRETVLFEGIDALLVDLNRRGIKWGIITNKHAAFTDRLVPRLNFTVPPTVVVSGDTCAEPKPSVLPMLYACERAGVRPENCVYVGDAERDMQAGRKAGMKTALADWGYIAPEDTPENWPFDIRIGTPSALLDWLV